MTSGNVQYDERRVINGKLVGRIGSKIWAGQNSPKVSNSKLPNPKPPKRAKRRADYPYTMSLKSAFSGLLYRTAPGGFNDYIVTPITLNFDPNNNFNANDVLNAVGRMKEKIQGSTFDMSVFLGTSHQSLRMIGDNAVKISSALLAVRKGKMNKALKLLGANGRGRKPVRDRPFTNSADVVSARWLELQYGWKPLVQDMYEGAQFVANQLNTPMEQRYRIQIKKTSIITIPPNSEGWKTQRGYHTYNIIAKVREKLSLIPALGLADPLPLIHELIPWSFVVDWFIPIGDWLAARAYVGRLEASYVTSGKTFGISENYQTTAPGWTIQVVGLAGYAKEVYFDRIVTSTFNLPLPTVKSLNQVFSWAHCRNAIALATQQVVGMRRSLR